MNSIMINQNISQTTPVFTSPVECKETRRNGEVIAQANNSVIQ